MKTFKTIISVAFVMILMAGCMPPSTTKLKEFPMMYEEKPLTVCILPPINESTAVDAKELYSTTIQEPLAQCGYYTISYPLTAEVLKMEGIYDSELLTNVPLIKFKEYFGADAVLFTSIKKWDICYIVISASMTVSIDCKLKSTTTDRTLWEYNGTVVVDLSGGNSGGGLAGLIAGAIATAINTAIADYVPYARQANYVALQSIPFGRYHSKHDKDQDIKFIDQKVEEEKEPAAEKQSSGIEKQSSGIEEEPTEQL